MHEVYQYFPINILVSNTSQASERTSNYFKGFRCLLNILDSGISVFLPSEVGSEINVM